MSSSEKAEVDSRYWPVPLARAVPAALTAVLITFSADHSARLGLLAFGGLALLTGVAIGWPIIRSVRLPLDRTTAIVHTALTLLAGAAALIGGLLFGGTPIALPLLFTILIAWGIAAGGTELYGGYRANRRHPAARDSVFMGALTVVLGIVVLVVPLDYAEPYVGQQAVSGVVTASIVAVGALGAFSAIAAVYLSIAGLSLKPASEAAPENGTTAQ